MTAGLAWQTLPEAGSLALVDAGSRRAVAITRPGGTELTMDDVVDIERLVLAWTDPGRQADAQDALDARLAADPVRTLTALGWLLAMWAVTVHLRTGRPPT